MFGKIKDWIIYVLVGAVGLFYFLGVSQGYRKRENERLKQSLRVKEQAQEVRDEVDRMDSTTVHGNLSKWMRD